MGSRLHRTLYLRFALLSLAAIALVAGAHAFVGSNAAAERERDAASRGTAALVAEPLRSLFDPVNKTVAPANDVRGNADAITMLLGTGVVRGVRVSSDAGFVLYQGGVQFPAPAAAMVAGDISSADMRTTGGAKLFVTGFGAEGYTIEVAQDASALADAMASARLGVIATGIAAAAGCWLLLQGVFWFGVRSLTRARGLTDARDSGEASRSSMDLRDVLARLAQDYARIGRTSRGLVALVDEPTGELILRSTFDSAKGDFRLHQRAIDEWFIRRCVATNAVVAGTLSELAVQQYFGEDAGSGHTPPLLCFPMAIGDRVVGVIAVVGSTSARAGSPVPDIQLMEQFAVQAALAIEQAILLAKVRSDANTIEEAYDMTLRSLMSALDAKDSASDGHCERVVNLTSQLCRQMGLPESMMVHIERGAMLHDVGEIGVPDATLKKPTALTAGEWQTMRRHPMLAGLMLSKIAFLEPALPILLFHHEKYDGTGYPSGLAGGNIPLEARIFAVVDAYEAMTHDRPYRNAMRHHAAMDEIRRCDGTQFDPEVVAAFEQLMASRPDLRGGPDSDRHVLATDDLESHHEEHVA